MKTVFDPNTREELLNRINSLNDKSMAQWGKMNLYQMLQHCTRWDDLILGKIQAKRMFIGKIFGGMVLKAVLKNDNPLRKNSATSPDFIIKEESGNIELQKSELAKRVKEYEYFNNPNFIHPFFGLMTTEQIGKLAYKHCDHHLRQFGA